MTLGRVRPSGSLPPGTLASDCDGFLSHSNGPSEVTAGIDRPRELPAPVVAGNRRSVAVVRADGDLERLADAGVDPGLLERVVQPLVIDDPVER